MLRNVVIAAVLFALPVAVLAQAGAGGKAKEVSSGTKAKELSGGSEAKELSGMSILGNDETAKALYIVPWKSSEIGLAADLRCSSFTRSPVMNDKRQCGNCCEG
jgi:hypothetical protein